MYLAPHLLLSLLERAAVAQLDGPAVVNSVVHDADADATVALVILALAARPTRRRLAARSPGMLFNDVV